MSRRETVLNLCTRKTNVDRGCAKWIILIRLKEESWKRYSKKGQKEEDESEIFQSKKWTDLKAVWMN